MTKAECIIPDLGFVRCPEKDMNEEKHDGSSYTIRVWEKEKWTIWCDSYYGRTIVFFAGKRLRDYAADYEKIATLVA